MEFVLNLFRSPFSGSGENYFTGVLERLHDHFIPHPRNNYHPHLFGHTVLGLFSIFLVSFKIFTIAAISFGPAIPAFSSAITISNIIALTNASREGFQLADLQENSLLDSAAQVKANDMLAKGYFAHNTPDGKTPWDFILASGYNYITAGENLAVNFFEAETVEQAWMNSPSHRANILNKDFEQIGIGISQGQYQGHAATFVVQMFGTPMGQKYVAATAPTQVQTQVVPVPPAKPASVATLAIPEMKIVSAVSSLQGTNVKIIAQVPAAVKVLALYGNDQAISLDPKPQDSWEGILAMGDLAKHNSNLTLVAYDIGDKTLQQPIASFAGSTVQSFGFLGRVAGVTTNFLGYTFNPKQLEQQFYLLFIAGMLTALVVAIAVRRHIQHLSLIANGSFVVMMAALLLWAG